ncbi:MAG TPA: GTP-binding protein [Burkholderiales bacterium]|nr:GTP-binding protein [Burkholderiales bacterium]
MQPLRFATAGSVDDGKSTLIGRLLYDLQALHEDQLAALEQASARRGASAIDLSLLTDGLEAEREQGITIDVAYRYFATPRRKFIIADSPGHEQYTRNMATGASNADALVLLVDVTKGLLPQTARHLRIARLLGIRQVIVFVNKMDLAGYGERHFAEAARRLGEAARPLALDRLQLIPGSALLGDMVVERGDALAWYRGATLLEALESLDSAAQRAAAGPLRFPVQLVSRPSAAAPRGYMGRIESGHLLAGSEIVVLPGARRTRVRQIVVHGAPRELAVAGDSVTLMLADDLDIARGDLIAEPIRPPRETNAFDATLVWLDREPLRHGARYLLQQHVRRVRATLHAEGEVRMNDIARAELRAHQPLFVDRYEDVPATGAFIVIDEPTHRTVAAGLIP